jgi:hypothetical protein
MQAENNNNSKDPVMTYQKEAFRPSSISRYINCNLWRFLPSVSKTPQEEAYLALRTKDHERLEQEQFLPSEAECEAYFGVIKQRCHYFFKEQRLQAEIGGEFFSGTPDVYGYDRDAKRLYVIDYKTGRSYVQAENNDQLMAYALLALETHPDWEIEQVELAILNTHHDAVNRHAFMGTAPILFLRRQIEKAMRSNGSENTFGKPGKWCAFCPSKRYCIRQRNYGELKDYADMDTDQLIYASKARQSELVSREREVKSGESSPLLSPLVGERSKRTWRSEADLPEKFYTRKPMTLTEAEGKFSREELVPYVEQTSYRILKRPAVCA